MNFLNRTNGAKELGLGEKVFDLAVDLGFIPKRTVPYQKTPRYHIKDINTLAELLCEYDEADAVSKFKDYPRVRELYKKAEKLRLKYFPEETPIAEQINSTTQLRRVL